MALRTRAGCDYREVELTCGSSTWGDGFVMATHAWVMPLADGHAVGGQRFAVTWDGLVYPVLKVGPPASVKADVMALPAAGGRVWTLAFSEDRLISHQSLVPMKACVLFLLGDAAMAERVWGSWQPGANGYDARGNSPDDPYMLVVSEWAWAIYDRMVGAHRRGDDAITMLSARSLLALQQAVQPVAVARLPARARYAYPERVEVPFLNFEDPPTVFLEDATRRVKAGPIRRVLDVGSGKFPDQKQRIAALIRDLEVAMAYQWSQPGWVRISDSAVVQALIREGQPAVEPLLKCLAEDQRLTRAVGFHRDFGTQRYVIPVDVAAYAALCGILQLESFGPETKDGYSRRAENRHMEHREVVTDEIRRLWERNKGLPPQEFWFDVLGENGAGAERWLDAAQRIVEPGRVIGVADRSRLEGAIRMNGRLEIRENDRDFGRPLAGDSLRGKKNPSVADLLAQRAEDIANDGELYSPRVSAAHYQLILCLAKWDLTAAAPHIHKIVTACGGYFYRDPRETHPHFRLASDPTPLLFEAGIQAGDVDAFDGYGRVMRSAPDRPLEQFLVPSIFIPLWRHPDDPKIADLARWMFLSNDSVWHPIEKLGASWFLAHDLFTSPLVGVPAFREFLKHQLTAREPVGTLAFEGGRPSMSVAGVCASVPNLYAPDVEVPKSPEKRPLLTCDFYASQLSALEGTPRYELCWPENRREAAHGEIAPFLDRWGNCFRDESKILAENYGFAHFHPTEFHLSPLPHPATAADVAAGRAIFSLRGRSDVRARVVALKPFPSIGRWTTFRQFRLKEPVPLIPAGTRLPMDQRTYKSFPLESYDREGFLWQAEEVQVDGKWHRYYGYVGHHIIAKVPAEEIELLSDFTYAHHLAW